MKNLQKRHTLIRKLFKEVAKETVGAEKLRRIKLIILTAGRVRASYCRFFYDGSITIVLNLKGIEYNVRNGYSSSYYKDRPERLNKYIKKNRHNALRFVLYHEARHAWQSIKGDRKYIDNEEVRERDADSWALAHIQTRPVKTFIPKATEYIRLYNLGYTTSKIALLCKIKDPRSVRYYLTKAGINLRRRAE